MENTQNQNETTQPPQPEKFNYEEVMQRLNAIEMVLLRVIQQNDEKDKILMGY